MKWLGRLFMVTSVLLASALVFTCGSSPMRWYSKADSPWRVRVLDKTVPHDTYREHAALFWVLRHEKVATPQGRRSWDLQEDYVGYYPIANDPDHRGTGRELVARDLRGSHMLYLADAYGVYTGDYSVDGQAGLDYSQKIYGGMTAKEVRLIEDFVAKGGHLVAEFNTFASPTGGGTRARLENLLGVHWSGWTGRYFRNLADEYEVPTWARREWKRQNGEEWNFHGAGYLFVHEDTRLFVLRESIDVTRPGLTIEVDKEAPLTDGALSGMRFNYWFDVIEPQPGTDILASFRLHAGESGRAILDRFGVPARFPALLVASEKPLRVYLAGDFSDAAGTLGPWWAEGLPWLNKTMVSLWFPRGADQEPFYWGFYVPVIRNLLRHYQP